MNNLFQKAKEYFIESLYKNCYMCGEKFKPDTRNSKRGWGIFCSKSCSIRFRNKYKDKKSKMRDYNLKKLGI
jgi:hypothetical protein